MRPSAGALGVSALAALIVGGGWLLSRCASDRGDAAARERGVRHERLLDLLTRSDAAEVRGPDGRRRPIVVGDLPHNRDDDRIELVVSAALEMRFPDVPIHPHARLQYEVGASKLDAAGPLAAVECKVFFERDGASRELLQTTIAPEAGARRRSGEVALDELAGARGTLVLKMSGPDEAAVAWSRLSLRSDGRAESDEDRTFFFDEVSADLSSFGATASGRGSMQVRSPGKLDLYVPVPPRGRLEFVGGAVPASGRKRATGLPRTAGLRLKVSVDDEEVSSRMHLAAEFASDPFRAREQIDLARYAGRTVRLRFEATPSGGAPDRVLDACVALPHLVSARPIERALRGRGRPDVFLFVVDTLRADALGCYGNPRATSPRLDAFAASGVVYEQARSQSSWTLPSTATLLTGLHPDQHGARDGSSAWLLDAHETIAETLALRGFSTAGFSANAILSPTANFDQGFETYQCLPWPNARKLARRMLDWLDDHERDEVFVYAQFVDPHSPYDAPQAGRESADPEAAGFSGADFSELRDRAVAGIQHPSDTSAAELAAIAARAHELYLDEVRYFDRCFGAFLDELQARGRLDDAIVVVTSDHGEEFLEHGSFSHGNHLYEESVHVPLIVRAPGLTPGRVDAPITGCDVRSLILELLEGGAAEADAVARRPRAEESHLVTEIAFEPGREGTVRREALLKGNLKLIETAAVERLELYDIEHDPGEQDDVSRRVPRVSAALLDLLGRTRDERARAAALSWMPVSEEVLAEMRAMGYVK